MKAVLTRLTDNGKTTAGKLEVFNESKNLVFSCMTLELSWRNNTIRKSCIPLGKYKVVRRNSPRFKEHYKIENVEGRSEILFHVGNFETDTIGCILVGTFVIADKMQSKFTLGSSVVALDNLLTICPKGFDLMILNGLENIEVNL